MPLRPKGEFGLTRMTLVPRLNREKRLARGNPPGDKKNEIAEMDTERQN